MQLAQSVSKNDTKCEVCVIVDGNIWYYTKHASTSRRKDFVINELIAQ